MSTERKKSRRENPLVSLAVNIVIPVIILVRFSGEDELGPVNGLLLALAFPVGYGLYDLIARGGFDPVRLFRALVRRKRPYDFIHWRRFNPYSILGFVSVLLTGGHRAAQAAGGVAGDQGGGNPVHHLRGSGDFDADTLSRSSRRSCTRSSTWSGYTRR